MRCDIKMYWKRQALKKYPLLYARFLELQNKPIIINSESYDADADRIAVSAMLRERFGSETVLGVAHVDGPYPIVVRGGKLVKFVNPA